MAVLVAYRNKAHNFHMDSQTCTRVVDRLVVIQRSAD